MKIAFLLPWNQDIAYWTQWADDNGIDGIELLYSSHDLPVPYEFKPEEIKRALEGKRVKICATTMFWINTISKDPEERKQARELNENTIKTASAIGCPYDAPQTRVDMARYMHSARIADDCLGIVMDAVREAGLEENTVIVFTTDHGIAFPHMKCTLYDTGIGVALIIKYPGNPTRGMVTDALVSQVDVFPTLCDLCGIDKPEWLAGMSLTDILAGKEGARGREEIFAEVTYHASYEPMRCIRTERYKLIRRFDDHNGVVPSNIDNGPSKQFVLDAGILDRVHAREMLFDLYLDPMERENLVLDARYHKVYDDLSRRLYRWMERTDDPLLRTGPRVPAPRGAAINKLTCLHAEYEDFESAETLRCGAQDEETDALKLGLFH